jgi:hypothetical protein
MPHDNRHMELLTASEVALEQLVSNLGDLTDYFEIQHTRNAIRVMRKALARYKNEK